MIIQSHDINLNSTRSQVNYNEISEQLDMQKGDKRIHLTRNSTEMQREFQQHALSGEGQAGVQLDFSKQAIQQQLAEANRNNSPGVESATSKTQKLDDDMDLPLSLQMIKRLLEKLLGKKIKIFKPTDQVNSVMPAVSTPAAATPNSAQNTPQQTQNTQWGMEYNYHEVQYHKESVSFAAAGRVTTGDGREINFTAKLDMSNETMKEVTIQLKAGQQLTDPLALNYDGQGVALTDEKYSFDLNSDGQAENISFLKSGSGFLVLDKNKNGQVDDGSELFGPTTDNGFLELKAYDSDNNDWIDENDAIYYQLNLWSKDESGADVLASLEEKNVGAIYLNSVQTQMDMGSGQLKETGVYLTEAGNVNYVQEVDLAT